MVNTVLCMFLVGVIALPLVVALPLLLAMAARAFLASPAAWIAAVLVLPHFASKALDRMYDAAVEGNYKLFFVYLVSFIAVGVGIRTIMRYAVDK